MGRPRYVENSYEHVCITGWICDKDHVHSSRQEAIQCNKTERPTINELKEHECMGLITTIYEYTKSYEETARLLEVPTREVIQYIAKNNTPEKQNDHRALCVIVRRNGIQNGKQIVESREQTKKELGV
jgi:hypothetical protein